MALLTLAALFFSFDFAVISAGLLIHAFVASNDQVKSLQAAIPRGTVADVDRHDIIATGEVSTAVQALIGALAVASALAVLNRSTIRPKFFVILGSLLAFTSLWLLSVTIAFTVIFATRSARVSAFIGVLRLPQSVISAEARALGISPVYKDQPYLLHAAILPWFTWLFTTIAAVAVFSESRADSASNPNGAPIKGKTGVRERTPSIA